MVIGLLFGAVKAVAYLLGAFALFAAYLYFFRKITMKDWRFLVKGMKLKRYQRRMAADNLLVHNTWEKTLKRHGRDAAAILFENKTYSMGEVEDEANRVANWLVTAAPNGAGLKAGDIIALLMENRPEYMSIWMGASKVGVKSALINTNLKLDTLVHSIQVSECKVLLFGAELAASVNEVANELKQMGVRCVYRGAPPAGGAGGAGVAPAVGASVDADIAACSAAAPAAALKAENNGVQTKDAVMFIYTSGTTGKPKAAKVSHQRILVASFAFSDFGDLSPRDRVYCCLPLYHSAAGIVGIGTLIQRGAVVVLKKKFSRRAFWQEIRDAKCTVVQYIGEVARYTLAEEPNALDSTNNVRLAIGNGMRPDVWRTWQTRFGVPKIMEFYAATEGAGALINTEGKESAIGFVSPLVSLIFPAKIFKFDTATEELIRDSKGRCVECAAGESGEFLMRIESVGGIRNYQGYTDEKASSKKVTHNVVKQGDEWFRSGDLLRKDEEGFVYFVDRIGDTFRWKGENVATTQVAEVMTLRDDLANAQVNVYGVEVPGNEGYGRAGMAAVGVDGGPAKVDLDALAAHVIKRLPVYARPYFLRFVPLMDMTGTFKYKKVELRNEGLNPANCNGGKDALFFLNPDTGKYQPIDTKAYADICSGKYRF